MTKCRFGYDAAARTTTRPTEAAIIAGALEEIALIQETPQRVSKFLERLSAGLKRYQKDYEITTLNGTNLLFEARRTASKVEKQRGAAFMRYLAVQTQKVVSDDCKIYQQCRAILERHEVISTIRAALTEYQLHVPSKE